MEGGELEGAVNGVQEHPPGRLGVALQAGWGLSGDQHGLAAASPATEAMKLSAQFPHLQYRSSPHGLTPVNAAVMMKWPWE